MAMLIVLFIIMAIAVISSGFIARSDVELQCGQNYRLRNEADYLAWAGLEHAKALVIDSDDTTIRDNGMSQTDPPLQLDVSSSQYYDLTIHSPVLEAAADPNDPSTYKYLILSSAYDSSGGDIRARSVLYATLFYDPNSTQAYYISVTRQ
jgi:hypothetical protein